MGTRRALRARDVVLICEKSRLQQTDNVTPGSTNSQYMTFFVIYWAITFVFFTLKSLSTRRLMRFAIFGMRIAFDLAGVASEG